MADLKLSRLPDRTPVRITITATPDLAADLALYLDLYRTAYDDKSVTVVDLIPAMLKSFLGSDRTFAKTRKTVAERQ